MKKIFSWVSIPVVCLFLSCNKGHVLDQILNSNVYVSPTLEDLQRILENEDLFSQNHGLTLISADQFHFSDQFFTSIANAESNAYTWNKKIFAEDEITDDWTKLYAQVFCANEVLAKLGDITQNSAYTTKHYYIEGAAKFLRGHAFFNLSQSFAPLYTGATARTDLGIPIRLTTGIGEIFTRSSVEQTYNCIISDLQRAAQVLPPSLDAFNPGHPSRAAAFALLARVFLSMRQYDKAGLYADSCLQLNNTLIDYNLVDIASPTPFSATNQEILYQSRAFNSSSITTGIASGQCAIDSMLYNSYGWGDLRRYIFFSETPDGKVVPNSTYAGNKKCFTGLAVDEMYLIRAECLARAGLTQPAMQYLNTLLKNRWRKDSFVPLTTLDHNKALQLILAERNKELVLRGQRWTDLRRLNKENASITLVRVINGQRFELPPNHNRYILPIPDKVISVTGMPQNPR